MKKILIVAAHPDDEILGCGGIIAKYAAQGCVIDVIIAAEGLTSRQGSRDTVSMREELSELRKICIDANQSLGVNTVEFLELPDNRMDSIDLLDVTKKIEIKLEIFQPEAVFTHFPSDLNVDHRILAEAVLTATRPQPGQIVKSVYYFEVPSSSDWKFGIGSFFTPNVFINIEKELEKKIKALKIYEGEMRPFPHARSIENLSNLAKVRGALVGYQAAEAFVLARSLIN